MADAALRCSYFSIGHPGSSHNARIWNECEPLPDYWQMPCCNDGSRGMLRFTKLYLSSTIIGVEIRERDVWKSTIDY